MLYIIIAVLAIALDQAFKYYITITLTAGQEIALLPGIVHLTYLENTGAAFSFMSGMRWILVGISVVCAILIIVVMFKARFGKFGKLMLALVLGGAVGNLIDRVWHGYVVDMFEVEFMNFAVFNVADIFITVCGILFVIYYFVYSVKSEKRAKQVSKKGYSDDFDDDYATAKEVVKSSKTTTIRLDEYDNNTDVDEYNFTASQILEEYNLEKLLNEQQGEDNGKHDA